MTGPVYAPARAVPMQAMAYGAEGDPAIPVTEETPLPTKSTGIGAPNETAASSDAGAFSLIALVKRLLGKFANGAGTAAGAVRVTLASDGPGVAALGAPADAEAGADGSMIAVLKRIRTLLGSAQPAGENLIGLTGTPGDVVSVTPALDTSAYQSGDVLFNPVAITNAARVNGGAVLLQSLTILDKDDQGIAMDLFLSQANNSLGTINQPPNISDANAENVHFVGQILASDWVDLGGCRIATLRNIGLQVEAAAGSRDVFLSAVTRGAPTHTASGLFVRAALVQF